MIDKTLISNISKAKSYPKIKINGLFFRQIADSAPLGPIQNGPNQTTLIFRTESGHFRTELGHFRTETGHSDRIRPLG